jgi:hypothetical protein
MNPEPKNGLTPLTGSLKARLDLIIQTVPHFWENCPHYQHFTNHSSTHSERIHRLLAQLAQELPLPSQLTTDEVFIVSAAAYLYEIGMQSSNLKTTLGFECPPGTQISVHQLLEIRQKKHLLSQNLIIDSVRSDDSGKSLGLTTEDDYTRLIAEVCRWISDEPLGDVPEIQPVHGVTVRVRLLTALLRLADQLYIDSARVNLDLLERAGLLEHQFARWWAYHYTQTLPIEKGQIRFHYFLPFDQREYLGHIRSLIESDFEFDTNSTMRWLLDVYSLKLIPTHNPSLGRYDQSIGFQRPMSGEMIAFLRQEVHPIPTPSALQPETAIDDSGLCLLVLDYENFIIQMGLEGYFLTPDQISRYVAQLRGHAVKEHHDGTINGISIGYWNRSDLRETAKMLDKWVYSLVTVELNDDLVEKISTHLIEHINGERPPKRIILVAPRAEMARTVLHLTQSRQMVSTWITNTPESEIFQGGLGQKYYTLSRMLNLSNPQPLAPIEFESCETMSIIRLHSELANSKDSLTLSKISDVLEQSELLSKNADWWQSWLIYKGVLTPNLTGQSFELNYKHPTVERVLLMRTIVLETIQTLSSNGQSVPQDNLLKELRTRAFTLFRQDSSTLGYLEFLKDEELIRRDSNPLLATQPMWQINTGHREYIALNPERYLAPFAIAFDHVMLRDEHFKLHEHNLLRLVSPYIGESSADAVYDLAQKEGWVRRRDTEVKLHRSESNLVLVNLNDSHAGVGKALRNRNILVNYLSGRNAQDGLDCETIWKRIHSINAFSLDDVEFKLLIDLLEKDGIVEINDSIIRLNKNAPITQRLFGRMNLYGLVRTFRRLGATNSDKKRPVEEIRDSIKRYVTNNNEILTQWVLDYATSTKLVESLKEKNSSEVEIIYVWMTHNPFVGRLDDREGPMCRNLANLVRTLGYSYRDGWVPQPVIFTEMDKNMQYGYSREEQEYWINQAIYRRRVLVVDKRKDQYGNTTYFVRVISN